MNRVLIIFSAYLLLLFCVPCMCDENSTAQHEQQMSKSAAAGDTGKEDHCSPFCSCFCCPSSAVFYYKELPAMAPGVFYNNTRFSYSDQHFISHNMHAIWQPPRLG